MVEPGQVVTQALKAEFGEEAMAKLNFTDEEREKNQQADRQTLPKWSGGNLMVLKWRHSPCLFGM